MALSALASLMVLGLSTFAIRNAAVKRATRRLQSTRLAHDPEINLFRVSTKGFLKSERGVVVLRGQVSELPRCGKISGFY